jgi:hypothetical protein
MITEVVTFKLPTGMTREELISNYRQTAPNGARTLTSLGRTISTTAPTDWAEEFTCGKI